MLTNWTSVKIGIASNWTAKPYFLAILIIKSALKELSK